MTTLTILIKFLIKSCQMFKQDEIFKTKYTMIAFIYYRTKQFHDRITVTVIVTVTCKQNCLDHCLFTNKQFKKYIFSIIVLLFCIVGLCCTFISF